jgi:hypothetical protein
MKRLLITLLFLPLSVFADVTVMVGHTWFGPADDGTYWDAIRPHNIELEKASWGIRYDTDKWRGYSLGVQYTNFGTARLDSMAIGADAPYPGGYSPKTKTCVGPCAPDGHWTATTAAEAFAFLLTKHYGPWSVEGGVAFANIATNVTSPITMHNQQSWDPGVVLGAGYAYRHLSIHLQVYQLEGKNFATDPTMGNVPSIFTGFTTALMVGYSL